MNTRVRGRTGQIQNVLTFAKGIIKNVRGIQTNGSYNHLSWMANYRTSKRGLNGWIEDWSCIFRKAKTEREIVDDTVSGTVIDAANIVSRLLCTYYTVWSGTLATIFLSTFIRSLFFSVRRFFFSLSRSTWIIIRHSIWLSIWKTVHHIVCMHVCLCLGIMAKSKRRLHFMKRPCAIHSFVRRYSLSLFRSSVFLFCCCVFFYRRSF